MHQCIYHTQRNLDIRDRKFDKLTNQFDSSNSNALKYLQTLKVKVIISYLKISSQMVQYILRKQYIYWLYLAYIYSYACRMVICYTEIENHEIVAKARLHFGHRESSTYKLWQSSWVVTSCLPYAVVERLLGISCGHNPGPGNSFEMWRNCRKCNILLVLYYVYTFCCTCVYDDVTKIFLYCNYIQQATIK